MRRDEHSGGICRSCGGSGGDLRSWELRCGGAHVVSVGKVRGWQIVFVGSAVNVCRWLCLLREW